MTDITDIKHVLKDLFDSQPLAVLATQGDGQPYTNLVAFVPSQDLRALFFATDRSTRKFANLSAEPRVSMLIDNRTNDPSDFRLAKALTATGMAKMLDKEKELDIVKAYLKKHSHLEDFLTSPGCALVKIEVENYYLVSQFQEVIVINMTP